MNKETGVNKICAECRFFDSLSCDGVTPFGIVQVNDREAVKILNKGACRHNRGLVLGILREDTSCRQPEGIFQPKT